MHECASCIKHEDHGGQCPGKWDGKLCILYERDPKGVKVYEKAIYFVPFYLDIPELKKPCDYYEINGIAKTVHFVTIENVEWNKDKKGLHGVTIKANAWYWSDENGVIQDKESKPTLKLIKGGLERK